MTKTYPSFIVDAFTTTSFAGNPAAVCLIPTLLTDLEYQKIAAEFNLSETAFPIPLDPKSNFKSSTKFSLRWFTPKNEVPLCGHATLATSHVLFNEIGNSNEEIQFETKSGILTVKKDGDGNVKMDFPKYELNSVNVSGLVNPLKTVFQEIEGPDFVLEVIKCITPDKNAIDSILLAKKLGVLVINLSPSIKKSDFDAFRLNVNKALEIHDGSLFRGLAISIVPSNPVSQGFIDSKNEPFDYACRYFGPWDGVNEDPATGSAQCAIGPICGKLLAKNKLYGFQAFPNRGAQFRLHLQDDRVILTGSSVTVIRGEIAYN